MNEKIPRSALLSILSAMLLSFMGILVETSLNVTYATLTQQLGVNLATIQWLTTGYLLVVTMMMIASAHLIKKYPVKSLFLFAITSFAIGSIILGTAASFPIMLLGRIIQGLSTGLSIPLMFHLILSSVPREHLATYTGMAAMIIALAPALGPTYGGILTALWSWRMIFWLLIPFIILVLILGIKNLSLQPAEPADQFDTIGFIMLSTILFLIDLAFSEAAKFSFLSIQFIGLLTTALILGVLYYNYNLHSRRHLIDFTIFKNKIVSWHLLGYFLLQFINIGLSFVIPQVAQLVLGQSSSTAGMMLLPGALLGAIVAPLAGRLMDSLGRPLPIVIGHFILMLGTLAYVLCSRHLTVALVVIFYMILRLGFNLAFGNTITDASLQIANQQKADINAAFNMAQQYAGSFGTGVLAAIIGVYQANSGNLATSTANGARVDYWLLFGLAIIALISGWFSYRESMKQHKN
ncbi:MFS transporter [Lapidilactobacillus bayanensis]|uniref:MFS transporter n=1 Tax=Lapidilactobacillus bayanensis TaxID=2485998 RepID=UPI000F7B34A4|nr:MFS transporter [Lapidilactobacillus bayanensis]